MAAPQLPGRHLAATRASLDDYLGRLNGLLEEAEEAASDLPRRAELRRVRQRLDAAIGRMADPLQAKLEALAAADENPVAGRWAKLRSIADGIDTLAAELLPVALGGLARAAGLDRGMCALAERLVDALARWTVSGQRVVVPAPREQTSTRTWVVGLPLREGSIWSLPIVAHEFGHVVAADLKDQFNQRLGENLLNGSWRDRPGLPPEATRLPGPLPFDRAGELFADVFAAYCTGPAYAAALMSRSIPAGAWASSTDHPPWGWRMRAVQRALGPGPLAWVLEWVAQDWRDALGEAGDAGEPAPAVAAAVDAFTDEAMEVMAQTASRARFSVSDPGVLDIGEVLRAGAAPAAGADLRTVLNAAWAERLRNRDRVAWIEAGLQAWVRAQPESGASQG